MGLYAKVQTDPELECSGVLYDYPQLELRITARRAGGANKAYAKEITRRSKDFQRAHELGLIDPETMEALLREVFAKTIVAKWETLVNGEWKVGIEGPDEELIPFNEANVIATFKALPYLFSQLREDVEKHVHYLASLREDRAGN